MSTTLRDRLLAGSLLAGLAALSLASPALAQQAPAPAAPAAEGEEEQVIVVTGSRLRRENLANPNPTVTVGTEEFQDRQLANLGDAIEDIPLVGLGGNTRGTQTQNGDSFILPDILDLGSQRTLTLLNGRRIQPTLPGTVFVPGNASGSQVDLSTINPLLIERVEVVAGTGGAIYGADAVGGVVNIITRDDYEGLNLSFQAGITELGDGEQFRGSALWGGNFLGDRLNLTVSVDYFKQERIDASTDSAARYLGSGITNPLEGSVRNPASFSAASAVTTLTSGGTLPTPFLPTGTDGVPSAFFGPLSLANPLISVNGTIVTRHQTTGGLAANTQVVPAVPIASTVSGGTIAVNGVNVPFFSPTTLSGLTNAQVFTAYAPGVDVSALSTAQRDALALQLLQRNRPTPFEYYAQNPTLNPLLFLGTFGSGTQASLSTIAANGGFPTVVNTDPATSGIFPRVAVPLQFNSAGELVAYTPGNYTPPLVGLVGSSFGGQGYDSTAAGFAQVQAGTERFSFGGISRFDITDFLRHRSELFYSKVTFQQVAGPDTNGPTGSTTGGSLAVPIFIDQNPYLSASARNQLLALEASGTGFTLPTFAGQKVLYLGRALTDVFGAGAESEAETTNYRIMQGLEGDFELAGREFYFDLSAYYGRSETISKVRGTKDIEFALAIDVVQGPNGPVCRQQTLAAPESITLRNPGVANITTGLPSLVPTAAQVAACQPLNLFGTGKPSQAAINYVTTFQVTSSLNTLEVYSGSFGGELIKLPAGWLQAGIQLESRTESAEFEPDGQLQRGLTRTALQAVGGGDRDFTEYGYEVNLPIFGEDFNFPGLRELELTYAFRQVEREQSTAFFATQGKGTDDDTFTYSASWKPVDDITFRGARSRSVRSASLVELFDPGIRAFGGLSTQSHPCAAQNIDTGPNPTARRANCVAAVQLYGVAATPAEATTFLASFNPTTTPNRPATAAGNPFLANEEANTYTLGFTWEPSFIPRLTFAGDFFSVDLTGELGLVGTPTTSNACFDSTSFPNSVVGTANPACDAFLLNISNGSGGFIVPTVNPLTGRTTILTQAYGGTPATANAPFEFAAIDFLNLNLARRELRAVNWEVRYNFELGELPVVGGALERAGQIFLRGTVYHTQRYDIFTPTLNKVDGEHGNPEFKTRFDIRHEIGPFEHTLQWFWQSETVTNVQLTTPVNEQSPAFRAADYNYFNYFGSYDISDNLTARFTINNLLDTDEPRGQYGIGNDFDGGVGREFIVGVSARF